MPWLCVTWRVRNSEASGRYTLMSRSRSRARELCARSTAYSMPKLMSLLASEMPVTHSSAGTAARSESGTDVKAVGQSEMAKTEPKAAISNQVGAAFDLQEGEGEG